MERAHNEEEEGPAKTVKRHTHLVPRAAPEDARLAREAHDAGQHRVAKREHEPRQHHCHPRRRRAEQGAAADAISAVPAAPAARYRAGVRRELRRERLGAPTLERDRVAASGPAAGRRAAAEPAARAAQRAEPLAEQHAARRDDRPLVHAPLDPLVYALEHVER